MFKRQRRQSGNRREYIRATSEFLVRPHFRRLLELDDSSSVRTPLAIAHLSEVLLLLSGEKKISVMRKPTLIFVMAVGILAIVKFPETEARMTLAQIRNAMKGMAKSCIGKSGVTPEVLAQSKNGEFPPDKALQCYYLCLFGQMKILRDGNLSLDTMNKQIDMLMPLDVIPRAKEVSEQCFDLAKSDDTCERSWQFTKCYYETDSSIYFFP